MNKRILELVEQATIQSVSENFTGSYSVSGSRYRGRDRTGEKLEITTPSKEWTVKFAEIIVRECIQTLVDNTPRASYKWSAEEDWDRGYDRAMRDCVHHIQEHFGVEE